MTAVSEERWVTDADLADARKHFIDQMPGFKAPVAYGVARMDEERLSFGYVNHPASRHRLPAVVMALVCGYRRETGVFPLTTDQFSRAISALSPAEAAVHWDHPNLWSWRELLEGARSGSEFLAFYVADLDDPPVDERDAAFRARLGAAGTVM